MKYGEPAHPAKKERPASVFARTLAERLRGEREKRNWTIQQLAERSGVSRAMISKIERGEASPTAAKLAILGVAFGMSMSDLLAEMTQPKRRLNRAEEQQTWRDPVTGYLRTAVSPPAGGPLQLVDVRLPPKAQVAFPATAYGILQQQIWLLEGDLIFHEGKEVHRLSKGDCLQLGDPVDCKFENPSKSTECRYVVSLIVG